MTEELILRERRSSAIHEAAHEAVAVDCGTFARAVIFPRENAGLELKSWGGNCQIYMLPLSKSQRQQVALAGVMANIIAEEPDVDPYGAAYQFMDEAGYMTDDVISATDRAMMTRPLTPNRLAKLARRIKKLWPEIERIANQLEADHTTDQYHG